MDLECTCTQPEWVEISPIEALWPVVVSTGGQVDPNCKFHLNEYKEYFGHLPPGYKEGTE